MKKRLVLFIIILSANSLSAKSLDGVLKSCLKKDWRNVSCLFGREDYYSLSFLNRDFIGKDSTRSEEVKGTKLRTKITQQLKNYIKKIELNECQKASLVKCVTSNIRFKDSYYDKNQSLAGMYATGKGVCRDYSTIFSDLAKVIGLEEYRVSGFNLSEFHAFNLVKINTKYYYIEPQSAKSYFYTLPKDTYLEDFDSNHRLEFINGKLNPKH